jgi:predicted DNA-binding transcriptional regulator YafY
MRAGDRVATSVQRQPAGRVPRTPTADVVTALRSAVEKGRPLVIGYVNAEASATERVIEPVTLEGGYVSAFDHLTDAVRTFAVARITGVAEVSGEAP